MNKYPPIYKFEATDARNPRSVDVTLKYDTPREVEGKYGTQYRYSATIDGTDYTIFATPGLHNAIQRTGAKAGETISVIRLGEGKETRWDIVHSNQFGTDSASNHNNPINDPFMTPEEVRAPRRSNKNLFYDNVKRYGVAWKLASQFLEEHNAQADHNAVAFTFYKMAQDASHDLLEDLDEESEEGKV